MGMYFFPFHISLGANQGKLCRMKFSTSSNKKNFAELPADFIFNDLTWNQ